MFKSYSVFNDTATTEIYTRSLHDALPILNTFIGTIFAATLIDPEIAPNAIDKAFRVYMLPQGMFSVAVATVLFPADRKSTRLNSSHANISYAVFCLKKKKPQPHTAHHCDR